MGNLVITICIAVGTYKAVTEALLSRHGDSNSQPSMAN